MRCIRCGCNNPDDLQNCRRCGLALEVGYPLTSTPSPATVQNAMPVAPVPQEDQSLQEMPRAQPPAIRRPVHISVMARSLWNTWFTSAPTITGTVIAVEQPYQEPADFSWPRFVNRMLLLIEFIGIPLLILLTLLKLGPLSIILAVLALVFLFKFVSPTGLFNSLRIFRFLNPFPRGELVPVQYFRVRDGLEREYIVRRKGVLDGQIMPGDEVALWGRFRNGILRLGHGRNLRTRASLSLPRNSSWLFLALHLAILGTLFALFYGPIKQTLEVFI